MAEEVYLIPEERNMFLAELQKNGTVTNFESRLKRKNGSTWWASTNAHFFYDKDGNIIGVEGITRDISELKSTGKALKESVKKYQSLFNNAQVALFRTSIDGKLLEINKRYAEMAGYSNVEDCLAEFQPANAWADLNARNEFLMIIQEKGFVNDFETKITRRDGAYIWILFSAAIIPEQGFIEGSIVEITDRKQIEKSLRESEARFKALHNASFGGIAIHDKGLILECNQGLSEITGYSETELVGMDGLLLIAEKSRSAVMNKIVTGYEKPYEAIGLRKNGEEFPIRIEARNIPYKGKNVRTVEFRDITEHKQAEAEREKLQIQLSQSYKMEALGTLAGGIAHDFNNILTGMLGYTELALNDVQDMPSTKKKLDRVLQAGERATSLVKQILSFSRSKKSELRPVNPLPITRDVLKFIRSSLPTNIEIRQSLSSKGYVLADATNIHQVLMNLCTNAAHAMKQSGGMLSVILQDVTLSRQDLAHHNDVIPGDFLKMTVEDTGVGMTKDVKIKAFDPFFTTKDLGEGTGMGLSTVHGIIAALGGFVSLNSEPGRGTSIQVFIPLITESAEDFRSSAPVPIKGGTERILFIDDEQIQIDLAEDALSLYGYKVTKFSDSGMALMHFQKNPDAYDLIITDMTMPKMTGDILTQKIHLKRPEIPIIMCTGFSELIDEKKAATLGINAFLYKPVIMADLLNTIRQILDRDE